MPQTLQGMMARFEELLFWQTWQIAALPSASRSRKKSGTWSSSLFFLLWEVLARPGKKK
jgi:hypothetical protein